MNRHRLDVRGRVQGVGFRPFVYRLATELGLGGLVGNDSRGAFIEVEGPPASVEAFKVRLHSELPQLARIAEVTTRSVEPVRSRRFEIQTSSVGPQQDAEITPDVATCDDCLAELFDPADRRYRYPFINCTNCGPRYSIVFAVPYDRSNTTMSRFEMCDACRREYEDPSDRRFHAQPNACPVCGPRVWLSDPDGGEVDGDAIRTCARRIRDGAIAAIKGIGGFHLACRADDDAVVERLRERKHREAKPLALMTASLEAARRLVRIDGAARQALTDPARPIVLMPELPDVRHGRISAQVAPGTDYLGIMLPYTPLHHLLFAEGLGPLVMTSGNPIDEPLCCDNGEALQRLAGMADVFLLHDRDIERRVDDSVMLAVGRPVPAVIPIRRARGYVPAPIRIRQVCPGPNGPVLALGGDLKSTVCTLLGTEAVISEHLGDLSSPAAYRDFVATVERCRVHLEPRCRRGADPVVVAYDAHPAYAASRYAQRLGLPATEVQHHHAHVVSCLAENGLTGRVIGLACDGTGYGPDSAIWGCELLSADEAEYDRLGHLRYFPLLGGDSAAADTWRPAAGLLRETFGEQWRTAAPFRDGRVADDAVAVCGRLMKGSARVPRTSSLGRLFDAMAFLLGVCNRNRYQAEAAMALEALARRCPKADRLDYLIAEDEERNGGAVQPMLLDVRPMIWGLIDRMERGLPRADLALAFHETVAAMLVEAVNRAVEATGLNRVVLSGGCFANGLLTERVTEKLRAAGRDVFTHRIVPPGDGGISLGQAVVAAERYRRGLL